MRIRVTDTLESLDKDLRDITVKAPREMVRVVRNGLKTGNDLAKDFARKSAGKHGKHYPKAFTTELNGLASSLTGGSLISGEYGPDSALPQGAMSFERGSRNQKPHLDLQRSADFVTPAFVGEVQDMIDRLFW